MERASGILLPIFSLPSPGGIGTLGRPAYKFMDFLHRAGQRWWQILPVGPTGAGDSPYSGVSTYAGNPMLIDLPLLLEDGLLTREELEAAEASGVGGRVDYDNLAAEKPALLRRAFERGRLRDAEKVRAFAEANRGWLPDFALFLAARERFGNLPWTNWPDAALRRREPAALERYRGELAGETAFHTYVQYLFHTQWQALKSYGNQLGIRIIGDLPIYVSLDSADVWASPGSFQLGGDGRPTAVAGVPPDYFCAEGQLWGNPLYDWDAMKRDGFGWWIRRVDGAAKRFDAIRIDHFRAFESYWAVPADASTAREGRWVKGPGMDLLAVLTGWFPNLRFIAEDLGLLTPAVHALREASGLPGMKVLEFAFSGPDNAYLPHSYEPHCVCYTGTHDNDTAVGWYRSAAPAERRFAEAYLGASGVEEVREALLRAGLGSVAELFIAQMQDWLGLGSEGRVNTPGVAGGNWRWRLLPGQLTDALADAMRASTYLYGRCGAADSAG
jgi:4-alpha-glucanotransferase